MPHLLLAILLVTTCAAGEAMTALATRGAAFAGAGSVTANGLQVAGTALGWGDIALLSTSRRPASVLDGGVVTRAGERLRGVVTVINQGSLACTTDLHGPQTLPLTSLSAVVLGEVSLRQLDAWLDGEPGAVLTNGERIAGTLVHLNDEAVGIDTGRRTAQVPRSRVLAVVVAPPAPLPAGRQRTWLVGVGGDRLLAESVAVQDGRLTVRSPAGTASLGLAGLVAAWTEGGRVVDLARRKPKRLAALDRIGAALPAMPGSGFPALIGGSAVLDGVRLPARGEVAWDAAGHATFMALAACPEGHEPVVARVLLDGAQVWEQTLRPGAAPIPVVVPLKGAAEVSLRAEPGPDGETSRRTVAWCHPLLVK